MGQKTFLRWVIGASLDPADIKMKFVPLTKDRWSDFETLFGERGACGGCWCMLWRLTRKEFESQKGEGNRQAMQAIVDSGEIPGDPGYFPGTAGGLVLGGAP